MFGIFWNFKFFRENTFDNYLSMGIFIYKDTISQSIPEEWDLTFLT